MDEVAGAGSTIESINESTPRAGCDVDNGSIEENDENVGMGDSVGELDERKRDEEDTMDSRDDRLGPIANSVSEFVIKEPMPCLPLPLANCAPVL